MLDIRVAQIVETGVRTADGGDHSLVFPVYILRLQVLAKIVRKDEPGIIPALAVAQFVFQLLLLNTA